MADTKQNFAYKVMTPETRKMLQKKFTAGNAHQMLKALKFNHAYDEIMFGEEDAKASLGHFIIRTYDDPHSSIRRDPHSHVAGMLEEQFNALQKAHVELLENMQAAAHAVNTDARGSEAALTQHDVTQSVFHLADTLKTAMLQLEDLRSPKLLANKDLKFIHEGFKDLHEIAVATAKKMDGPRWIAHQTEMSEITR